MRQGRTPRISAAGHQACITANRNLCQTQDATPDNTTPGPSAPPPPFGCLQGQRGSPLKPVTAAWICCRPCSAAAYDCRQGERGQQGVIGGRRSCIPSCNAHSACALPPSAQCYYCRAGSARLHALLGDVFIQHDVRGVARRPHARACGIDARQCTLQVRNACKAGEGMVSWRVGAWHESPRLGEWHSEPRGHAWLQTDCAP